MVENTILIFIVELPPPDATGGGSPWLNEWL
jgi:hypothetical protein